MTESQLAIIRSTVPVLQQFGEEITRVFYLDLLAAHPELKSMFNADSQADGTQRRRLAGAILAYAANIDKLVALDAPLDKIARAHTALNVLPEQYPVVGFHLLEAIKTVLGDSATPEIIDAWAAAYGQLADIMIAREAAIYQAAEADEAPELALAN